MKRKLVRFGKHTLMATIPSEWISKNHLKKGDSVEFTDVGNKLVLTSTAEIFEKRTEVDVLSPTVEVIWRVIQPAYTAGYDEVKINFRDRKALKIIESNMQNLIGFEIVETSSNYVIVKSVAKQLDEEFPIILRRVWLISTQMTEILAGAFEKGDKSKLDEIRSLEFTINKYIMFLQRLINRTGYKYSHYMYLIITYLELSSNHLEYVRRYFESNPRAKMGKISKEANRLCDLSKKVYDLYYNFSEEKFVWIAEAQPHFKWFKNIGDPEIKSNFKAYAEYLVLIARQIKALHMQSGTI